MKILWNFRIFTFRRKTGKILFGRDIFISSMTFRRPHVDMMTGPEPQWTHWWSRPHRTWHDKAIISLFSYVKQEEKSSEMINNYTEDLKTQLRISHFLPLRSYHNSRSFWKRNMNPSGSLLKWDIKISFTKSCILFHEKITCNTIRYVYIFNI